MAFERPGGANEESEALRPFCVMKRQKCMLPAAFMEGLGDRRAPCVLQCKVQARPRARA